MEEVGGEIDPPVEVIAEEDDEPAFRNILITGNNKHIII